MDAVDAKNEQLTSVGIQTRTLKQIEDEAPDDFQKRIHEAD